MSVAPSPNSPFLWTSGQFNQLTNTNLLRQLILTRTGKLKMSMTIMVSAVNGWHSSPSERGNSLQPPRSLVVVVYHAQDAYPPEARGSQAEAEVLVGSCRSEGFAAFLFAVGKAATLRRPSTPTASACRICGSRAQCKCVCVEPRTTDDEVVETRRQTHAAGERPRPSSSPDSHSHSWEARIRRAHWQALRSVDPRVPLSEYSKAGFADVVP